MERVGNVRVETLGRGGDACFRTHQWEKERTIGIIQRKESGGDLLLSAADQRFGFKDGSSIISTLHAPHSTHTTHSPHTTLHTPLITTHHTQHTTLYTHTTSRHSQKTTYPRNCTQVKDFTKIEERKFLMWHQVNCQGGGPALRQAGISSQLDRCSFDVRLGSSTLNWLYQNMIWQTVYPE